MPDNLKKILKLLIAPLVSWLLSHISQTVHNTDSPADLLDISTWRLGTFDDAFAIFVFLVSGYVFYHVLLNLFKHRRCKVVLTLFILSLSIFLVELLFISGSHFSVNIVPQFIINFGYDFVFLLFLITIFYQNKKIYERD